MKVSFDICHSLNLTPSLVKLDLSQVEMFEEKYLLVISKHVGPFIKEIVLNGLLEHDEVGEKEYSLIPSTPSRTSPFPKRTSPSSCWNALCWSA